MLSRSLIAALLVLALISPARAQTSGTVLIGQGAGQSPKYTLLSQDCTNTNAGLVTCTQAGGGTGSFQLGSLGVGTPADGVAGDGNFTTSINVGNVTTSIPDTVNGDVTINNSLICETNNVGCVIQQDSTLTPRTLLEVNSGNTMVIGNNTVVGQLTQVLGGSSGSVSITSGSGSFVVNNTGDIIQSGLGGALKLTSGSVLSMTGGTKPTLTAGCNGAGSSVATGSTDNRGKFTTQTAAATTCTMTFNHTFPQAPFCEFTDCGSTITPVAYSTGATGTTTAIVDFVSATNAVICYQCF